VARLIEALASASPIRYKLLPPTIIGIPTASIRLETG
jgi:hypothetical protein